MRFDCIWTDARLATLAPGRPGLGIVERGALAAKDGRIAFAGPSADLPVGWDAADRVRLDGRWITPGLIDCHTHLVYAGDRAHEFEMRLAGATLRGDRARGRRHPLDRPGDPGGERGRSGARSAAAARRCMAEGVTTVEIKSGYGLDLETEARMLRAARRLARERGVGVVTTLPRRACAAAGGGRRQGRATSTRSAPMISADRRATGWPTRSMRSARRSPSTPAQTERVFAAAQARGLPVKLHADQLSNLHGGRARGRARRAVRRPSRIYRRGGGGRDGAGRNGRGAPAGRVLLPARDGSCRRSMPAPAPACRSRSRPTAIPARRR